MNLIYDSNTWFVSLVLDFGAWWLSLLSGLEMPSDGSVVLRFVIGLLVVALGWSNLSMWLDWLRGLSWARHAVAAARLLLLLVSFSRRRGGTDSLARCRSLACRCMLCQSCSLFSEESLSCARRLEIVRDLVVWIWRSSNYSLFRKGRSVGPRRFVSNMVCGSTSRSSESALSIGVNLPK